MYKHIKIEKGKVVSAEEKSGSIDLKKILEDLKKRIWYELKIIMIVFSFYVGTCASCQIGKVKEKLNLNDSASVRNFIKTSTVCDRLKFMEENLTLFVSDCLYSRSLFRRVSRTERNRQNIFGN
ncbi:MAG: hypothetical protein R2796_08965 [Chitinophagaceae bacterium]